LSVREDLSSQIRRFQYTLRYHANMHPWLYMPVARRLHADYENRFIEDDTELVIEGFGRSGSTFMVLAFESVQRRPVKTAHHTHAAAQVIVAARRRLPTLLIVRPPLDAALAHMDRRRIPPRPALAAWIRYHSRIAPYLDRILPVELSQVSTDVGAVIRAMNEHFGTDYEVFEHTPENEATLFEQIERDNVRKYGGSTYWVAKPTPERAARKAALRSELEAPDLADLRERAEALHRRFFPVRA
jgi:hypothetical protein